MGGALVFYVIDAEIDGLRTNGMNINKGTLLIAGSLVFAVAYFSALRAEDKAVDKPNKGQTAGSMAMEKADGPIRVKSGIPEGTGKWVKMNSDGKTCPKGSDGPYQLSGQYRCWVKSD